MCMKCIFNHHNYKTTEKEVLHKDSDGDIHYPEFIVIQVCQTCGKVKVTHILPSDKHKSYGCKGVK